MSEEESDTTTIYPDIGTFENNEAEDNENNHDIQITTNLGSPKTQPVAQTEQSNNEINNTATIETSDKVSRLLKSTQMLKLSCCYNNSRH